MQNIGAPISSETQTLLRLADEEALVKTIWGLSLEQKKNPIYKEIGEQRYLSALRVGEIDNAEMAKNAFKIDPFFLKSKLVKDATLEGIALKEKHGDTAAIEKIKKVMGVT